MKLYHGHVQLRPEALRRIQRIDSAHVVGVSLGSFIAQEVGASVTHVAPGDAVVLNWCIPCGTCFQCKRGDTVLSFSAGKWGERYRDIARAYGLDVKSFEIEQIEYMVPGVAGALEVPGQVRHLFSDMRSEREPMRWNPCEPIQWVWNPSNAPSGAFADVQEAVRVAVHGRRRAIDTGRVAGRTFLNLAGVGFDAF